MKDLLKKQTYYVIKIDTGFFKEFDEMCGGCVVVPTLGRAQHFEGKEGAEDVLETLQEEELGSIMDIIEVEVRWEEPLHMKPCPFCGGDVLLDDFDDGSLRHEDFQVYCRACEVSMVTREGEPYLELVSRWNERVCSR